MDPMQGGDSFLETNMFSFHVGFSGVHLSSGEHHI